MKKAHFFELTSYEAQWKEKKLLFSYRIVLEDDSVHKFTEVLHLPREYTVKETSSVNKILQSIHFILGTSYYKLCAPDIIKHPYKLSPEGAHFWNTMYTIGMGEFYYINNLKYLHRELFFAHDGVEDKTSESSDHIPGNILVQHGGGKDSIVSVETIKKAGINFDLYMMGESQLQNNVAQVIGKEPLSIKRKLDPHLFELNKTGDFYDGHVPVAAMYGFTSLLIAALEGYSDVIVSHEASSNYGNVSFDECEINHQWDKSIMFENALRDYLAKYVDTDIQYYSLLRPFHEIVIVKLFTQYPQYFDVFSSSNHHFRHTMDDEPDKRWDVAYSKGKVEFMFALFAAWLTEDELMHIFEENIFDREDVVDSYRELAGISEAKPLDCVGTPEETKLALYRVHERGLLSDTPVMNMFKEEILPDLAKETLDKMRSEVFAYGNDENIPSQLRDVLAGLYADQGFRG